MSTDNNTKGDYWRDVEGLQKRIEALERFVADQIEPWHVVGSAEEPSLLNGWTNTSSSTYGSLSFRKDSFGIVHVRGVVGAGASGSVIFVFPSGYRPPGLVYESVLGDAGVAGNYVSVDLDGTVSGFRAGPSLYMSDLTFHTT